MVLTPNSAWGGDGSLGCGIGYGYLHRIPVDEVSPPSAPFHPPPVQTSSPVAVPVQSIPSIPVDASLGMSIPSATTSVPDRDLKTTLF